MRQRPRQSPATGSLCNGGEIAQARAVVLLENKPLSSTDKPLLPFAPQGKKVYLFGVDAKAAQSIGLIVVTDPAQADLALIRAPAPYQSEHLGFFFGSSQHEGKLEFTEEDAAYAELLRISRTVPTVFLTTLERPLILTNVVPHATALLGDFGISDEALLALITGAVPPTGHLPFELPSSAESVSQQKSDLSHRLEIPVISLRFRAAFLRTRISDSALYSLAGQSTFYANHHCICPVPCPRRFVALN